MPDPTARFVLIDFILMSLGQPLDQPAVVPAGALKPIIADLIGLAGHDGGVAIPAAQAPAGGSTDSAGPFLTRPADDRFGPEAVGHWQAEAQSWHHREMVATAEIARLKSEIVALRVARRSSTDAAPVAPGSTIVLVVPEGCNVSVQRGAP